MGLTSPAHEGSDLAGGFTSLARPPVLADTAPLDAVADAAGLAPAILTPRTTVTSPPAAGAAAGVPATLTPRFTVTEESALLELAGLNFVAGAADFGAAGMLSPAHERFLLLDAASFVDLPELMGADLGATAADAAGEFPATLTPRTTVT